MNERLKTYFTWGRILGWVITALLMVFVAVPIYLNVETVLEAKGWHRLLLDFIMTSESEQQVVDGTGSPTIGQWYWVAVAYFSGLVSFFWLKEMISPMGYGIKFILRIIQHKKYKRDNLALGANILADLLEEARHIREETSHDPMEERAEWFEKVREVLREYYPLAEGSFRSVHNFHMKEGWRDILGKEMEKLSVILVSIREAMRQ